MKISMSDDLEIQPLPSDVPLPRANPSPPLAERDAEVAALWECHAKGDKEARNRLVERYFGIADANAANIINIIVQAIEESDFRQAAVIGFMEAIDAYPKAETTLSFEDFSSLKIRAAIFEELMNFVGGE